MDIEVSDDWEEVAEDAREAELKKKTNIGRLKIEFNIPEGEKSVAVDVLDALEPHPNLEILDVWYYPVSRFPEWIVSPANQLRRVSLVNCDYLSWLPPMGKLPFLEELEICNIPSVEFVGREFLGMTTVEEAGNGNGIGIGIGITTIGFPKLRKLLFHNCNAWKEWQDITAEDEHSALISIMPCLTHLSINSCWSLQKLPHRLMRNMSSLEVLTMYGSEELSLVYEDKEGEAWKSISLHNPRLRLQIPGRWEDIFVDIESRA